MRGSEREKNLAGEAYYSDEYFSYEQLWSFAEQIYHIKQLQPENVVEIGIGNGFVSEFLRAANIPVTTFDINPALNPDVVAPLQELGKHVEVGQFDLISCCEVLEHLPFEDFERSVQEFSRYSRKLLLALPVCSRNIGFGGTLHFHRFHRWLGIWLQYPKRRASIADMHYWEVDHSRQTRNRELLKVLGRYYSNVETGLFKANPYHRYYQCTQMRK